jgi:hypothetical protein
MPDQMADNMETRVSLLEQIARSTEAVLERLDQRMDRIEMRMEAGFSEIRAEMRAGFSDIRAETHVSFGDIRTELREMRREHRNDTWRVLTVYLASFAALLGVMAHGFHWL